MLDNRNYTAEFALGDVLAMCRAYPVLTASDGTSASSPWWRVPYDPAHPLTTPRGVKGNDPQVQQALADAVEWIKSGHLPLDATPGGVQRWNGTPSLLAQG